MNTLILATSNPGKIQELQAILSPIRCIPQLELNIPEASEHGYSFIENALLKARHASQYAKMPALADDSGLVVPALDGAPGIYSARYSGIHASDKENIQLLLQKMQHLKKEQRKAYFYCAIALVLHPNDPTPIVATGRVDGVINPIAAGTNGFGYDPIFYLPEYQCTMAELPATIKNNTSHRAKALCQLRELI